MLRTQWQSYTDQQNDPPPATDGVSYLPELGVLQFHGPDALAFLQGYLTCDTIDLPVDILTPMAVCNLKGRVVVNGWCYRPPATDAGDVVTLVVHASLSQRLTQFFKNYLVFSRTELVDLRDANLVFGTSGAAGTLMIDARHGLIVVNDLAEAQGLWTQQPRVPASAWRLALIRAAVPLISLATSEAFLPQMLDLERLGAVDFDKGCYLGQEVVARAQHRGEVKRRLQRLQWSGQVPPASGAQFAAPTDPDRKLGTVINAEASIDGAGECLAVVANDAPGPFQIEDTILSRTS